MRAELTASQEDYLLDMASEKRREAQDIEQEKKQLCEFCKTERANKEVKIEGGEVCFLCEGCGEELEVTIEECR